MTPRERLPFAMGMLMTAVFTGTTLGPLAGVNVGREASGQGASGA